MRLKRVAAAVVRDAGGQFLLTYSDKWGGYSFPARAVPDGGDVLGSVAVRAVEDDLGVKLPDATAAPTGFERFTGVSRRTGEDTTYEFSLFEVNPGRPLDLTAAPAGTRPVFLSYADLRARTDLTWTCDALTRALVERQNAVLAVVTRAGASETEFLVVHNDGYKGFFFPARRVRTEGGTISTAVGTVRTDLGYFGPATAAHLGAALDAHFSDRFGLVRQYRFHVCDVQLPDADLHRPDGVLEQALKDRGRELGRDALWLPGSKLSDPTFAFSPTMAAVQETVRGLIPPRVLSESLRKSEGGFACIERKVAGRRERLLRWNPDWRAFNLVGGRRIRGESYHDCAQREVQENLGLTPAECPLAPDPCRRSEYLAVSGRTHELTAYTMETFAAAPTPALARVTADPWNLWVTDEEVQRLYTHDGRAISPTVRILSC